MLNVKVSHLEIKTIGHEICVSLKQYLDLENMSDNMLEVRIRVLVLCVQFSTKLLRIYKKFQYFKRDLCNRNKTFRCFDLKIKLMVTCLRYVGQARGCVAWQYLCGCAIFYTRSTN